MRRSSPFLLRSAAIGALALSLAFAPSRIDSAAAATLSPTPEASAHAEASALKRLPAGPGELVFRGENASGRWSVFLTPTEAGRIQYFQLAMLNTVVVLPERSSLRLFVNDRLLATVPVRSADGLGATQVRIPPGVLTPGANDVQIRVALAHRVDCSIKATYELWALLDPSKTGFVAPGEASAYSIRSLDDLAAEPAAEDGTTRIHLRLSDDADPAAISRAGRLVVAVARRAGLLRPVVEVGPDEGQGAGFDLVAATGGAADGMLGGLRVLGREDGLTMARNPATNRLIVGLTGADDADLETQLVSLERSAPKPHAIDRAEGVAIASGGRATFAELGLAADEFAGRHYLSTARLSLPSDFFSADDVRARLLIDGARSGDLDPSSELIFRVNGAIASSMRLGASDALALNHRVVELPLRFFHPGHNEIAIEGLTSTLSDRQCDLASQSRDSRLTIAGTSELEFPEFAHLRRLPGLSSALVNGVVDRDGQVHLYLPDAQPGAIGAGLSVLANMASQLGAMRSLVVHLEPPERDDAPGVVIASLNQLPEFIATPLRATMSPQGSAGAAVKAVEALRPAAGPNPLKLDFDWNSMIDAAAAQLRNHGFFYGAEKVPGALTLAPNGVLIGAVSPTAPTPIFGGLQVPDIVSSPRQWLVVTARSVEAYGPGVGRMIADGRWSELAGQAVSFDPDSDQLRSVQPTQVSYVLPDRFDAADVRPILGGVFSDNIPLSLCVMMLLMATLGLSTHALIRRMGSR